MMEETFQSINTDSSSANAGSVNQQNYRTINGTGNNGDKGAANSILVRLFEPSFGDDGSPRGGNFDGSNLANPRSISNIVHNQRNSTPNFLNASDWLWQWGQFIDHDLDLNEANGSNPPTQADRMPIDVPAGDPTFPDGTRLPFIRVPAATETGSDEDNPRPTANQITAFIDASSVYGSDEERAEFLRDRNSGKGLLKTSFSNNELLLPLNDGSQDNASGGILGETQFVAGDIRANEQLGLTAVHTLFIREHNRIATNLFERINAGEEALIGKLEEFESNHSRLSSEEALDEFIYQAARKVVGAQVQAITYKEFLPFLIGEDSLEDYDGYDPNINPQISTEFANAAYRLGHTLLNNQILEVDGNGKKQISLVEAFFNPEYIVENGVDSLLSGLIYQPAQELDHQLVDGVRNFLFPAGGGGLDLASVNIARGRDVGLPSYTEIHKEIFGVEITSFSDLGSDRLGLFSDPIVSLLERAYDSVEDIDLWVGGISELPDKHGGLLGPTLSYFIADQFGRTRDGDEFFYLREEELEDLNLFAPGITEITLADIIRNNTSDPYLVTDNVFEVPFDQSIIGNNRSNVLRGSKQRDFIDGLARNDLIFGLSNDDQLFGGNGKDTISGGSGSDIILGGNGSDRLLGNSGHDVLVGGLSNDEILGNAGNDIIDGQAGSDTLNAGGGFNQYIFGADLLDDGFRDVDRIIGFRRQDLLDVSDYVRAGGLITFDRVNPRFLRVDLNGEDQINIFGSRQALNVAESQLSNL